MRRALPLAALSLMVGSALIGDAGAHPGMGAPTWNREISRIVFDRCISCHRPEGTAFSLLTYLDAQPRANEIKDAVLARRMPPWGAIKGFGQFRNDQSLSPEQIELIVRWVDAGIRRGSNPNQLPPTPPLAKPERFRVPPGAVSVREDGRLDTDVLVDGLFVEPSTSLTSARIWATLPTGAAVPLVWLHDYHAALAHPFLLRSARSLPAGTRIQGLPHGATVVLIPPARN
jgi:hypothetical protein